MSRILYIGTQNASSWALRAWLALREQGIDFEERLVDLRPPQRALDLAKVGEFSPPAAVPVLVDGDTVIFDSLAIMEYASDIGERPLLPADPRKRARARSLLAWMHSGLSGLCGRLSFESSFYPQRRAMTAAETREADRILKVWNDELASGGSGPYLAGDLSLADLGFVPVVRRLQAHQADTSSWPLAAAWMQRLMSRPAVAEWMAQAESLPPVWLDDYAAPEP
ncbi:MAG TPA: glutathione S-transferase family protein [Luteimonas sp.]|nr:glutathione S-transferase family protein [Luteimonas sp.]